MGNDYASAAGHLSHSPFKICGQRAKLVHVVGANSMHFTRSSSQAASCASGNVRGAHCILPLLLVLRDILDRPESTTHSLMMLVSRSGLVQPVGLHYVVCMHDDTYCTTILDCVHQTDTVMAVSHAPAWAQFRSKAI
jgi:hypothetical protein